MHDALLSDLSNTDFLILTFKLLLLEVQAGLVKQIHALHCQHSSDSESTGKS